MIESIIVSAFWALVAWRAIELGSKRIAEHTTRSEDILELSRSVEEVRSMLFEKNAALWQSVESDTTDLSRALSNLRDEHERLKATVDEDRATRIEQMNKIKVAVANHENAILNQRKPGEANPFGLTF